MKIVLAPDKFKGCMRSPQICEILKRAFKEVFPGAEVISIPMADGGEGTVEAIVSATGGEMRQASVSGPLGKPVDARFGLYNSGRSAVMEMASASGMELLSRRELDPLKTSTYGTGELIKAILDCGVEEITIGIGGSATVDDGAGMAQALGYKLLDQSGKPIALGGGALRGLAKISTADVDPRLFKTRIKVASDVNNPLLGRNGAARIYGPQKGATPEMVEHLEAGLSNLERVWRDSGLLLGTDLPGDGAAGGLGGGLRAFCKVEMVSGARLVIEATGLEKHIQGASFVVTGEGRTDSQTTSGKLCCEVAKCARKAGIPVILLSGSLSGDVLNLNEHFDVALSISTGHGSLEEAIASGRHDLYFTGRNLARLVSLRIAV